MPDSDQTFVDRTLVAPLQLDDVHGRLEFDPLKNITAHEAVLIAQLFVALTLRRTRLDWREYLNRHELVQHFKDLDAR